jgi:putative hydrolase of the HAD superfamily
MSDLTTIAFDADDTLWHNETHFHLTQTRFAELLADAADPSHLAARLEATERRNLQHYGYGVKGFMLSMIETAIEVTDGRVAPAVIREIMEAGREMLDHPIELLPHARATVEALSQSHRLLLITKGDLLHQERKIAASGLGDMFHAVEIVSEKTTETYRTNFARHAEGAERALMVGNSMKSDVLPAIAAGAHGVHVPFHLTWSLEHAEPPQDDGRFHALPDLSGLPGLVGRLMAKTP